jgi:hypothetical protein
VQNANTLIHKEVALITGVEDEKPRFTEITVEIFQATRGDIRGTVLSFSATKFTHSNEVIETGGEFC